MEDPKQFNAAIDQISEEKGISKKIIFETIEQALAAAFRKDYGQPDQNIKVTFSTETGDINVVDVKEVVAEMPDEKESTHPLREFITLADAKKKKKDAKVGDTIREDITPAGDYGRIAAQTAKQVIIQRIREAEQNAILSEYADKEGEVVNATVQRVENHTVFLDLGTAVAVMPPAEQVRSEQYATGQRLKALILEVRTGGKGPEIIVTRSHPKLVEKLFELEVPEIYSKVVTIESVAREGGSRSKIAVKTTQDGVDPVGSCVGQRGTRVQTVITELGGEKIDIIEYHEDPQRFVTNALSPAKVMRVDITSDNEEAKEVKAIVADDQLSLAIGKGGQNVRLAAKLTGWKIDIVSETDDAGAVASAEAAKAQKEEGETETPSATEAETKDAPTKPAIEKSETKDAPAKSAIGKSEKPTETDKPVEPETPASEVKAGAEDAATADAKNEDTPDDAN